MSTYELLEKALEPARLKALAGKEAAGTGGPAVLLPDSTSVTRDVIIVALDTLLKSETVNCLQLVQALTDDRVHVRYGAWLALQRITDIREPYFYPFQSPGSPANVEAIERWKELCEGFSSGH